MQTVLVIEDEEDITELVAFNLRRGGLEVETACDGLKGLAAAKNLLPDLIVLDLMMPGMDGPTTLKALQNTYPMDGILVLFMTAKVQNQEIGEYLKMGAGGVITKPFEPMNLPQQLRDHWAAFQSSRATAGV